MHIRIHIPGRLSRLVASVVASRVDSFSRNREKIFEPSSKKVSGPTSTQPY